MRIWRIARNVYDPLNGEGARQEGGRWNPVGTSVVYAYAHLSLAVLEQLVHVDPEDLPDGLAAFEIDVPEDLLIETVEASDLPSGWNDVTTHPACQEIGRRWTEGQSSPVLRVPSAVVPREANYLVNPEHPEAERIRVAGEAPFQFDERLPGRREE
jgi:RES domain-containing protein